MPVKPFPQKHISLRALIQKLNLCCSVKEYTKVFKSNLLKEVDFSFYLLFDDSKYTRVVLHSDSCYELILICWKKGQGSPIHDHADSECIMCCLKGKLEENLYSDKEELTRLTSRDLNPLEPVHLNNTMGVHQITSLTQNSVSLHLYIPGIINGQYYDQAIDEFL